MRLSLDIPSPYYQTAQKRLTIILVRALGSQPVPSTSPTNQCVQGGSGTTMAARQASNQQRAEALGSTEMMPEWNLVFRAKPCRIQKWKLLSGS